MIRAYFDESGEGVQDSGYFTVSGYVFSSRGLKRLETGWKRMLVKYKLPYFRMSECNSNSGVFTALGKNACIECEKEAISLARTHTLHGCAYVLKQEDYREVLMAQGFDCDSYSFLLWGALIHVSKWRDQHRPKSGLQLFFEDGYKHQSRANELLRLASQDPRYKQEARVTEHGFFAKEASYPGQAADLLAWHVRKGYSNSGGSKPLRKDTIALIKGISIKTIHYDKAGLTIIRDQFVQHSGSLARAARILFNPNGPLYEGA